MPNQKPLSAEGVIELAGAVDSRLGGQIGFLLEIDRLKTVIRRSRIVDGSRYENTAEHSWHLGLVAMTLSDWAAPDVDIERAVRMLLVHDIVEVDAGDVYIYDEVGRRDKAEREQAAADRIFGLLPADQGTAMRALWDEYEERSTATARFGYAVDRLQPLLLNASSGGVSWSENDIRADQVIAVNKPIGDASAELWSLAQAIIEEAVEAGALRAGATHAPS